MKIQEFNYEILTDVFNYEILTDVSSNYYCQMFALMAACLALD